MKAYLCKNETCETLLFEQRAICPKCKGVEFGTKEVEKGISAISTIIRVTRNGNTDPINLVYAKAESGLRVLCRSTQELNIRENILFSESEGSVNCSRKKERLEKSVA